MEEVVYANVAGLNIEFVGFQKEFHIWDAWSDFIIDKGILSPDLIFHFKCKEMLAADNMSYFSIGPLDFHVDQNHTIFGYMRYSNNNNVDVIASRNWAEAIIESVRPTLNSLYFELFTDIVYRTRLADFSGFTAHASVIEHNGCAVMFSASSGVGKSTHAELWNAHFSSKIINGDHAVIRLIDGSPVVFGAPWSGTSPYKKKFSAPLKAIVLLEQSDSNTISHLGLHEASQGLLPHCYLPYWDQASVANTLCHIDTVLGMIPVYRLKCLPNRAAAELVRDTIFGC